jgi:hypothetical protein
VSFHIIEVHVLLEKLTATEFAGAAAVTLSATAVASLIFVEFDCSIADMLDVKISEICDD